MELKQYLAELFERKSGEAAPAAAGSTVDFVPPVPPPPVSMRTPTPTTIAVPPRADPLGPYRDAKRRIHAQAVELVKPGDLDNLPEDRRRPELRPLLERLIEADPQSFPPAQRLALVDDLLDDILGFGPLEPLLRDPTVGDILVNGAWGLYVERAGVLQEMPNPFEDEAHLMQVIHRIVVRVGRQVNESSPMVDARLPDGSRFNAVVPPLAINGPLVSIRRFGVKPIRLPDLLARHALTPEMARFLEAAVAAKLNILVSGGTGSGKTTLLNALSAYIPNRERIVTIEDAAELQLQQRHVGRLEARPANVEGKGQITIRDLVRNALRMRPDRIVVGECRGAEALDMLQAMNTGHSGSLTTLHANTPRDAIGRLETMLMMTGLDLPLAAMRHQIASAVNLIVHVERLAGGARRVTRITEVTGMEQEIVTTQDLFAFVPTGVDASGRAVGRFEACGVASHYLSKLKAAGQDLPPELFQQRTLLDLSVPTPSGL